ncbi:MAG: CHC2 zinc finger domain-containing protein [Patescibacteria group bacterium]
MDVSDINLMEYLNDKNIPYSTTGKNVSSGWIGTACPWCGDTSNHLGINLDTKVFSCWRCGEKGNFVKLVMELESLSFKEAMKQINQYGHFFTELKPKSIIRSQSIEETFSPVFDWHKDYLTGRGFDADQIIQKYKLQSGRLTSDYAHRLVIPYFVKGKMVTFTSRDVTGKAKYKYKHLSVSKSIIPTKEALFNIDSVKNSCIVCEGCLDVFRIGDGSVALGGVNYTKKQLIQLMQFKRLFILFDPEDHAQVLAKKLGLEISSINPSVEIIKIKLDKDPGDLTEQEAKELRRELLGK